MQKVTENYLSKVTRYFYFVIEQHCQRDQEQMRTKAKVAVAGGHWRNSHELRQHWTTGDQQTFAATEY